MTDDHLMKLAAIWDDNGHIYAVKRNYQGHISWYLKITILYSHQEAKFAHAFKTMYGGHITKRQNRWLVWSLTSQDDQKQFLEIMGSQLPNSVTSPLINYAMQFLEQPPEWRGDLAELIRITNLQATKARKLRKQLISNKKPQP